MTIKCNLDKRGYLTKPSKYAGAISSRTRQAGAQKELTPAELLEYIKQGYTFTPAVIGGTIEEHEAKDEKGSAFRPCFEFWESQQIIVADIDNEISNQLAPAAALEVCQANGLDPFCIYKTFSYTPEHEKYRIMLVLQEAITDFKKAYELIDKFGGIFNAATAPEFCADTSIEPVKLIFGGRSDCVIYQSENITPLDVLEALPEPPTDPDEKGKAKKKEPKQKTAPQPFAGGSELERLEYNLNNDIRYFDLSAYIEQTTQSRRTSSGKYNPCPICGHNDCFDISGAIWDCHSSGHGYTREMEKRGQQRPGGSILDYLMQLHGITLHAAYDMFKFDIMGYDREEWKKAYKDAKQAEEHLTPEEWKTIMQNYDSLPEYKTSTNEEQTPPTDPDNEQAPTEEQEPKRGRVFNGAEYLTGGQYDADINEMRQYAGRKMGLHADIDNYLTLYPGLAVLGGQASLGKTTLAVNMAAQLLARGEHVLYFALEQKADEIITKFAARYIYDKNPGTYFNNLDLHRGDRRTEIAEALAELPEQLQNLYVIECDFMTTRSAITGTVDKYMQEYKAKPIVIIDYLQIIPPPEGYKGTSKTDYIDENLKGLKAWQKDAGLFVIVLSSFNRSNNYKPVSYESFLYTSAIEYTCDYVWGLQLQILDPDNEEFYIRKGKQGGEYQTTETEQRRQVQEAQEQINPKKVQFVSLKNRKGKQFFKANFNYYPAHDYYEEDTDNYAKPTAYNTIFDKIKGL